MWDASKCDLCGDCLVKCRYVDYDRDRAVSEMKLLMESKAADILDKCITCNACFQVLPHRGRSGQSHLQDAGEVRESCYP